MLCQVLTVCDGDMIKGVKMAASQLNQIIEEAAGASLAAAVLKLPANVQNVGVVLCGGNIGLDEFAAYVN